MSQLVLEVDAQRYSGWETVRIGRSIEAAAGSFSLVVSDRRSWPIPMGAAARALIDDEPVVTGNVERVAVRLDGRTHQLEVSGRDTTGDLVDSSAIVAPGEWHQSGLARIAREIASPFGIAVEVSGDEGEPFLTYGTQPGETCFEVLERAARLRGLLVTTSGNGKLLLARPSSQVAPVALVEGVNLLGGELELDDTARFRRYVVRGQHPGGEVMGDEATVAPEGEAFDHGARDRRELLVIAEGAVTPARCTARAQWEATVRAARGARFVARVRGWRQAPEGELWQPNRRVHVVAPTFGLDAELFVISVGLSLDIDSGELTPDSPITVRSDPYTLAPDLDVEEDTVRNSVLARHQIGEEDES